MAEFQADTDDGSTSINNESVTYFDFFGLPRELRDRAYEYMCTLAADKHIVTRKHFEIKLLRFPSKDLFLVSCQFKHELESKAMKVASALVDSVHYEGVRVLNLPYPLPKISSMELHLMIVNRVKYDEESDRRDEEWFHRYRNALTSLLPVFGCLRAVSLNLRLIPRRSPRFDMRGCEADMMKQLPKLLSVFETICPRALVRVFHQHLGRELRNKDGTPNFSRWIPLELKSYDESTETPHVMIEDEPSKTAGNAS